MAYARDTVDNTKFSIINYCSSNGGSRCGYCGSSDTNINDGMWAYEMTVHDYQALIDRGWRRCGQYLYKPRLKETCCAMYTIKCGALEIKLSKSQKKILKKMSRFIANDERFKSKNDCDKRSPDEGNVSSHEPIFEGSLREPRAAGDISILSVVPLSSSADNIHCQGDVPMLSEQSSSVSFEPCHVLSKKPKVTETKSFKPGVGADDRRPPCKKAKLIRMEKKKQKLLQTGKSSSQSQQQPKQGEKSLEDFFQEPDSVVHRLRVELVRSQPRSAAMEKTFKEEFELYQLYQMTIHGDPISRCTELQFKRFLVNSPLQIDLVAVKSRAFQMSFRESSTLFAKYQKAIHRETDSECGPDSFIDFLKNSPLKAWKPKDVDGPEHGYGSFHQQYWLDEKLIAVGVLDILPDCVSSVYFFYDPEYSDLSLGTYGALREVGLTRELHQTAPDLKWYYMGFYIHTCPKMRYKAGLSPSYLLCPEAFSWHPVEECVPKLDKAPYCRFQPDQDKKDPDGDIVLDKVALLWKNTILPFKHFKSRHPKMSTEIEKNTEEYAALVGKKCAENMLLVVS